MSFLYVGIHTAGNSSGLALCEHVAIQNTESET